MNDPLLSTEEKNSDFAAYPSSSDCTKGLTKRELFAAMAIQGLCSAEWTENTTFENLAVTAVKQADALLAALDVAK